MTIEQMMAKKKELGYSNNRIAELSGVPVGTVQKIFSGETKAPRYETMQALSGIFENTDKTYHYRRMGEAAGSSDEVHEAMSYRPNINVDKTSKTSNADKTLEDYMALPEGARIEMIDGKFYDMAAPTTVHQRIALELGHLFSNYIDKNNGKCIPFVAPTDVQLDCDNRTMVQPDVLVVCNRDKITKARVVGAPDLIVEVLSPSNFLMDLIVKLVKYKHAGVREYWIIVPDDKKVFVYYFEKSSDPDEYSFEDTIPVNIWNGECKIDFSKIYEKIEFMY